MVPRYVILNTSEAVTFFKIEISATEMADEVDCIEIIKLITEYIADIDEADNNIREFVIELSDMFNGRYVETDVSELLGLVHWFSCHLTEYINSIGIYKNTYCSPAEIFWYTYSHMIGNDIVLKEVVEVVEQ